MNIVWESVAGDEDDSNPDKDSDPNPPPSNPFSMTMTQAKVSKIKEEVHEEKYCQIYDTIPHDFVKHYMCPYLVSMAIKNGSTRQLKRKSDECIQFAPKLGDDLNDRQWCSELKIYQCAEQFRRHPI